MIAPSMGVPTVYHFSWLTSHPLLFYLSCTEHAENDTLHCELRWHLLVFTL